MLAQGQNRPLNSHGATMRLTISTLYSQSHGRGLISPGLLSLTLTDLLSHMTGGFNPFWEN